MLVLEGTICCDEPGCYETTAVDVRLLVKPSGKVKATAKLPDGWTRRHLHTDSPAYYFCPGHSRQGY